MSSGQASRLRKLFCVVFGHNKIKTEPDRGICSGWRCERCGMENAGITWPKPPPMPPIKPTPTCDLRDFYDSALELLSFTQVSTIIANAKRKTNEEVDDGNHSATDFLRCRAGSAWPAAKTNEHEPAANPPEATCTASTTKGASRGAERMMDVRNMASFAVAPHLIEEALLIPKGHEIFGAEWDYISRNVRLFVEGPDLPEVELSHPVPNIMPFVTVAEDENGQHVKTWHWNLDNTNRADHKC